MGQLINIREFVEAVYHLHDVEVNQKYHGVFPFSLHLRAVDANIKRFKHLLDGSVQTFHIARAGGLLHDSIEDARLTYEEVKAFVRPFLMSVKGLTIEETATEIADVVYLCTEYKGRTPEERYPDRFYTGLRNHNIARYVKLCDIGANRMYSKLMNQHDMYMKYVNRFPRTKTLTMIDHPLGDPFQEIYDYIDAI